MNDIELLEQIEDRFPLQFIGRTAMGTFPGEELLFHTYNLESFYHTLSVALNGRRFWVRKAAVSDKHYLAPKQPDSNPGEVYIIRVFSEEDNHELSDM